MVALWGREYKKVRLFKESKDTGRGAWERYRVLRSAMIDLGTNWVKKIDCLRVEEIIAGEDGSLTCSAR
jgi:hypothetical protein